MNLSLCPYHASSSWSRESEGRLDLVFRVKRSDLVIYQYYRICLEVTIFFLKANLVPDTLGCLGSELQRNDSFSSGLLCLYDRLC